MTFAALLINTCTVERATNSGDTNFGNPTKAWTNHLADQACRLSGQTGREAQNSTEVTQVDEVLFMQDVDVTEGDRVTVDSVLYEIVHVTTKQDSAGDHHKELDLVRVKA